MAKLLGPDFLSLQVRDLAASRTFYTQLLGLPVDERFDTPDFVLFDTTTIPFALRAATVSLDEAPQPGWGMTLWIDCDAVDALHTTLEAAGVTIIQSPFDGPFGRTMIISDPDGYRITVNENPWDRFPLGGRLRE
ncbi:MAG TPA: VOC family protein [Ktedonobacterales bacterium]|nr:VOC family protein [Ktedonobacterales bacterium]